MKKLLLSLGMLVSLAHVHGQTLEQTMYIDFGPNVGTNGAITVNPDLNNNYWNNPTSGAVGATYDIVNNQNTDTGIDMEVTNNFIVNTSINYGPTAPVASLLGDLAIGTATQDYWYLESGGSGNNTGQVTFSNLTAGNGYKFYIFASRPTTAIRKTAYTVTGLNSFNGQIQTSDSGTGNINTILETTIISPDANGTITIDVSIAQDAFGYMNVIKMEEYNNLPVVDVTSITVTGTDIITSGGTSQMMADVLPADATYPGVVWSVDDTSVAIINENGMLIPTGNGSVTVTATSATNPDVSGSTVITISDQWTELYLNGSATENGDNPSTALPMHMVTGLEGTISNIFEIYTSLDENGTFSFYNGQGDTATMYGENGTAGIIEAGGDAIDPVESGPVRITVNLATGAYTILPINWSVVGSSIAGGWGGDETLTYQGNGVWQAEVDMTVVGTDTNPRFVFKANQSWSYVFKKITGSQHSVIMESVANEYGVPMSDIDLKYGNFIITLDLGNYTYGIECVSIDPYKISFMGSSVINGQGATGLHGYAYLYNEILQDRAINGSSPFYRSNISVNGNTTVSVLNRFEKDLVGDCSSYVVFGLALGNEGIHEAGQVAFDQYNENLQQIIDMTEEIGKTPVVFNNYGRGDYNTTDYEFIKEMNLMMAQWDVPSTNLLGAMDNGTGNWVDGYWDDGLHPNDAGHAEFAYAIVPSLFDALEAGKPQPQLSMNTYITPDPVSGGGALTFTPDNTVHSFTVSFDIQTTGNGHMMAFTTNGSNEGSLLLNENGYVVYTAPSGSTITGTIAVNDGAWHKVTLTHYYAWSHTVLYTDATAEGSVDEQLEPQVYSLHGTNAPANINYRNWFFYRSGMNEMEITALNEGAMLKSSLELYAPLDSEAATPEMMFANKAQSTNTINSTNFTLGTKSVISLGNITAYPNPVKDVLTISTKNQVTVDSIEVYNTLGMMVQGAHASATINLYALQAGIYMVKVKAGATTSTIKIIKE
ncbi:T9SS type A sorting domain-containing protein [Flavobacterium rhizosphaerae]|uniref:T9SS type A sorting domain-containing protein n=1 Tax=Flavobacterium rhizosphaerae TaxID=3163298 RepID=A0ABW8YXH7_9FLAO